MLDRLGTSGSVKVRMEVELGCVDVFADSNTACVFLPEPEVIIPSPSTICRLNTLAKVLSLLVYYYSVTKACPSL